MSLPSIVVVLFLQSSVQVGLVEGINFDGAGRTELSLSVESVPSFKTWVAKYVAKTPNTVSFCVVNQDYDLDGPLAEYISELLIAREDAGELDIYSNYKNILASGGPSPKEVTFRTTAAYCIATISTIRGSQR